jgi:hypothetical protein
MFQDSTFDWQKMKQKMGENAYKMLEESNPDQLPLDKESQEELKVSLGEKAYSERYYPKTEKEYIQKFVDNMQVCHMEMESLKNPIKSETLLDLHATMQSGITKRDQYNCGREAPFLFLPDGENNMVNTKEHVKKELDLMDKQTELLFKNAKTKEEKVRAALFQGLRWVGIHPANDGNKRMMKMIMNQTLSNLGMSPSINKKWDNVATEVFKQAIHGNNLSGFLKATEEIYGVDLKVKEYEIPPFRLMPERESKNVSLENSRLHDKDGFSTSPEFARFDKDLLKTAKKEMNPLNLWGKKIISNLNTAQSSEEALKVVNKLEGKISNKTLQNLRYLCGVSESGYKPYLDETTQNGKMDESIKSKFIKPIVIKESEPSKDLSKIVSDSTVQLEQSKTKITPLADRTRQITQTSQMVKPKV